MIRRLRLLPDQEDIVLELFPHLCVTADDIGERGASYLHEEGRVGREEWIVLLPEAVAVA